MTADLSWQFDLVWALADLHLSALVDDDFLWEPAGLVWTMRPGDDDVWRPDWADTEPDPIPVPTIAWLLWHITWWWSTAIDDVTGTPPRPRSEITWSGDGGKAVSRVRDLAARWCELLGTVDLTAPSTYPWGPEHEHTAAHTALWVNVELTKNISEIGQLRLLRAAGGT